METDIPPNLPNSAHMRNEKDKKHSHYLRDGDAIGFALESMGGISQSTKDCINHLYNGGEKEKQ